MPTSYEPHAILGSQAIRAARGCAARAAAGRMLFARTIAFDRERNLKRCMMSKFGN